MKSRISFFDAATWKKDITRFAPLWVLYTVLMLITVLPTVTDSSWYHPVRHLEGTLELLAFFNMLYAAIVAQLLFSELFNSRLCNALHAMPVTREARFGSHVCTGLAFSFVPNLLTALLMMPTLGKFWFTAILWLSVVCLQYVFFFGVGVLSVMCTGSRFAMVLVYGLINFLAPLVYWFISVVFLPSMPGVVLNDDFLESFCPLSQFLGSSDYFRVSWDTPGIPVVVEASTFDGLGEDWGYLGIVAILGIAFLAVALFLYRRRRLESAGDFIAVKWLSPLFLSLYTLCGGAFLCIFGSAFGMLGYSILLILGLLIGFFTGKMLLERTTRVFRKRNFLHAGIFAAVLLVALLAVKLDVFGIVHYVPEVEDVEYVTVNRSGARQQDLYFTEEKQVVQEIHRLAVADDCDRTCGSLHQYILIEYHLRNGQTVTRSYNLCEGTPAAALLNQLPGKY